MRDLTVGEEFAIRRARRTRKLAPIPLDPRMPGYVPEAGCSALGSSLDRDHALEARVAAALTEKGAA